LFCLLFVLITLFSSARDLRSPIARFLSFRGFKHQTHSRSPDGVKAACRTELRRAGSPASAAAGQRLCRTPPCSSLENGSLFSFFNILTSKNA